MIKELKTCPVCGGEGTYERHDDGWATCSRCGMEANSVAADAIEEMNTREERTCEYIGDEISGGCSVCRGWLDPDCAYCPHCGAKVCD